MRKSSDEGYQLLLKENEALKIELAEARETLRAIHEGEVDAIVVSGPGGDLVFSLSGTESVYRLIVASMKEAALTVAPAGRVLYCNAQFAEMIGCASDEIVGRNLQDFICLEDKQAADELLLGVQSHPLKQRLVFQNAAGSSVPAYVAANLINQPGEPSICIVAADLTELENSTEAIRQLREQREQLHAANDRLSELSETLQILNSGLEIQKEELAAANEELQAQQQEVTAANEELAKANRNLEASRERERARTEELRQSEEKFAKAFQGNASAMVITRLSDGLFIDVNNRWVELTGFDRNDVVGRRAGSEVTIWKDPAGPVGLMDAIQQHGMVRDREARFVRANGEEWIGLVSSRVATVSGEPVVISSILDITARKRAEERLRESEERFRALVTASSEVLYRVSPDWSVLREVHSRGLLANVRTPSGTWVQDYIPREDQPRVAAVINEAIRNKSAFELECRVRRNDGTSGWMFSRAVPLTDANGEIVEWFGAASDITARKRAEAAQQALIEERGKLLDSERNARLQADRANRIKDEFLANLSHELRTPLNSILGWTQLLRGGHADPASIGKALEVIERNSRMQAQLVSDLLDMSRIISGKVRLEMKSCDPVEALEAAIDSMAPAAAAKRIKIEKSIEPLSGPMLGDASRLQQAFWNLLSNAVKFTPAGGCVKIVMRQSDSRIEVVVRDTGIGVNPDFLPHIFERFRQADSSASRHHGGLGLGLAIVKHLIELHGGTVKAESPGEGRGAAFTIELPITAARPEDEAVPVAAIPPAEIDLKGIKVLFVDDEADTREMATRLLAQHGAGTTVAGSAAEAISLLQEIRPDVVIGDIGMPGEDGYEMIRKIRQLRPEDGGQTPAIALTAYSRLEDRTHAMIAGYQYHLAKPVDAAELITTIAMLTHRLPGRKL